MFLRDLRDLRDHRDKAVSPYTDKIPVLQADSRAPDIGIDRWNARSGVDNVRSRSSRAEVSIQSKGSSEACADELVYD
jgi:hypothetical protein